MKNIFIIAFTFLVLSSCSDHSKNISDSSNKKNYDVDIESYLEKKRIEPTAIINLNNKQINFLDIKINWKVLKNGIEFNINDFKFNTLGKVTQNDVWGAENKDSLSYANNLYQIKYYDLGDTKLLGLVINYEPCTGIGCGVNYQIIYDLNNHKLNYFGRFRTGFDFDLYNFDSDNKIDYLSKTFYGRNSKLIDTTEYNYYSREINGNFLIHKGESGEKYYIRHIYHMKSIIFQKNLGTNGLKS